MVKDSSATMRVETPHASSNETNNNTDIKHRARALIENQAIDACTRSILQYGLEINDPVLAELVCMVEQGESLDDNLPETYHSTDRFITTQRSRSDLMNEQVEAQSDRINSQKDYSIEYEATERGSMLDHEWNDEFREDPTDDLATDAANGNGGRTGAHCVASSWDDEPEPLGRFSDCESFAWLEHGLIEDPLDDAEEIEAKLKKLISLICRAGNEPDIKSAALLSLLATLWHAPDFVNTAKNLAFMHCCELDLYGIVESQIEMIEQELLAAEGT